MQKGEQRFLMHIGNSNQTQQLSEAAVLRALLRLQCNVMPINTKYERDIQCFSDEIHDNIREGLKPYAY